MMNFEVIGQAVENAKIKVVGVGGAGGNAVIHMINHNIEGVDFICANTDTQALSEANGAITLKLGNGLTKGLGAGANPDVGRKAAESDRAAIEELLVWRRYDIYNSWNGWWYRDRCSSSSSINC